MCPQEGSWETRFLVATAAQAHDRPTSRRYTDSLSLALPLSSPSNSSNRAGRGVLGYCGVSSCEVANFDSLSASIEGSHASSCPDGDGDGGDGGGSGNNQFAGRGEVGGDDILWSPLLLQSGVVEAEPSDSGWRDDPGRFELCGEISMCLAGEQGRDRFDLHGGHSSC